MIKHYVLTISPDAEYNWEQKVLRNPLTGERPDLTSLVTEAVGNRAGSYLVAVKLEVEVLEQVAQPSNSQFSAHNSKLVVAPQPEKLAVS